MESAPTQNAQTVSELPKELMDNELLPKYKRDLVAKLKCLRAELNALQPQSGHCRLEVSRNEIFEVGYFHFYTRARAHSVFLNIISFF